MAAKKTAPVFGALDRNKTLAENSVNAGPVVLDSNVTLTNPEGSGFQGGAFSAKLSNATAADDLSIAELGGISVQKDTGSGATLVFYNGVRIGTQTSSGQNGNALVVALDGPVDNAAATALARAVTYSYSADAPSAVARTLTFSATDAEGSTTVANMKVKLKAENDAAVFSGLGPASSHTPAVIASGVVIDGDAHVVNTDGTGFKGGKLAIHLGGGTATDQLFLSPGAFSINGTKLYLNGTQVGTVSANGLSGRDLTFTFKGNAAISDAQMSALIEQVSYRSTASAPSSLSREVTFTVTDAEKSTVSAHVALAFENQAPAFITQSAAAGISLVSVGAVGQPGNDHSFSADVSADGTQVAFVSFASSLVEAPGAASSPFLNSQVLVKNLQTGEVRVVSTNAGGEIADDTATGAIAFSPDGLTILFGSRASNLVEGDTNGAADIFLKDLETGAITRVSTNAAGGEANAWSDSPTLSPDGSKLAFASPAANLVEGDTNGAVDIFVKDLVTGAVTRVSTGSAGEQAGGASFSPAFSPDGAKVAFLSTGDEDGLLGTGNYAIYLKDLATGELTFVSYAGIAISLPVFSPDGDKLAFLAYPQDAVPGSPAGALQLYVKDLATGELTVASSDANGTRGTGLTEAGYSFSPDGTRIVFASFSSNLVPGDTDGVKNIFVKDLETGAVVRIENNGNGASSTPVFAPDGAHLIFTSSASNLVAGDANAASDIFMVALPVPSKTSAVLTEDADASRLTASGAVYFVDTEASDTHTVSVSAPKDALGTLSARVVSDLDGSGAVVWSYSVDGAAVAPLASGETREESFVVKLADDLGVATSQTITVTLIGTGDAAAPQVASFARATAPAGASESAGAEGTDADPWAPLRASLSGIQSDLSDVFAALEARIPGAGDGVIPGLGAPLSRAHPPADDLPEAIVHCLEALAPFVHAPASDEQPGLLHDLAEVRAAQIWAALHHGQDAGHSFL
ncbi:VCBS domain-containing protein [Xanthobacter sp.]|uniref:VCBS domain-containing protein n=1 Tax=Xanthobacter sp. TaxID=35809 RepID=UPI0025D1FDA3|nr:VCBS domain-containing protein [Xanthobacter sp.]